MPPTTIHFLDILIGRAACSSALGEDRPRLSVDPGAVTCPACRRFLRAEGVAPGAGPSTAEAAGEGKRTGGGG